MPADFRIAAARRRALRATTSLAICAWVTAGILVITSDVITFTDHSPTILWTLTVIISWGAAVLAIVLAGVLGVRALLSPIPVVDVTDQYAEVLQAVNDATAAATQVSEELQVVRTAGLHRYQRGCCSE